MSRPWTVVPSLSSERSDKDAVCYNVKHGRQNTKNKNCFVSTSSNDSSVLNDNIPVSVSVDNVVIVKSNKHSLCTNKTAKVSKPSKTLKTNKINKIDKPIPDNNKRRNPYRLARSTMDANIIKCQKIELGKRKQREENARK